MMNLDSNIKAWIDCHVPLSKQENNSVSCSYEKPQLMELAVPAGVACGGSNYDLGDDYNEGEETTEE